MKTNEKHKTKLFGIIGHPIGHSLSPLLHNTAFKELGLPCKYEAYDVELTSLGMALRQFRTLDYSGLNVTIPYKEIVRPLLDGIDEQAKKVGAINTILLKEGKAIGYNTDVAGVATSLQQFKNELNGKEALVLGAGGAARAVLYALIHYFNLATVTVANRSQLRVQYLVKDFKFKKPTRLRTLSLSRPSIKETVEKAALIINATPVGMFPDVQESPLTSDITFRNDQIVMDLIYRPVQTTLLKRAEKAGARTISGLEMFLQQGARAFELWTGETMPLPKVRKVIEKTLHTK